MADTAIAKKAALEDQQQSCSTTDIVRDYLQVPADWSGVEEVDWAINIIIVSYLLKQKTFS